MSENRHNYYATELKNTLEKNTLNELKLKVTGDKYSSKWLNLNRESIKEIRLFLNRVKILKEEEGE